MPAPRRGSACRDGNEATIPRAARILARPFASSRENWRASRGHALPTGWLRHLPDGPVNLRRNAARRLGEPHDAGKRVGAKAREEREPAPVVDRQVVRPWVQLDRQGHVGTGMNDQSEDVEHRDNAEADRPQPCQQSPRGVKASTASLMCVARTWGASARGGVGSDRRAASPGCPCRG